MVRNFNLEDRGHAHGQSQNQSQLKSESKSESESESESKPQKQNRTLKDAVDTYIHTHRTLMSKRDQHRGRY